MSGSIIERYIVHALARGTAESSVRMYVHRLDQLARVHPDLLTVSLDDLEDFLAVRRGQASETRKGFRTAFRSFYRWAYRSGLIDQDPTVDLDPIPVSVRVPRVADDASVSGGLVGAPDDEAAMILLARLACLRLSEIVHLKIEDRHGDLLRFIGKGDKERIVPIHPDLAAVLTRVAAGRTRGYFFPGRTGEHVSKSHPYRVILRRTGYNPHALRHAGATAAYEATGDLEALRRFLGHASIATTQRYLHVGMNAVRAIAAGTSLRDHRLAA